MSKKFILVLSLLTTFISGFSQQWAGPSTTTGAINRDGIVSIGTTTATAKLNVRGTLRFESQPSSTATTRFLTIDSNGNVFYRDMSGLGFPTMSCTQVNFLTKRDASGNLACSKISEDATRILIGDLSAVTTGNINDNGAHVAERLSVHGKIYGMSDEFLFSLEQAPDSWLWFNNQKKTSQSTEGDIWRMANTIQDTANGLRNGFTICNGYGYNPKFFIEDVTGSVGIGTVTPPSGYKLAVAGKIICEEMKVQLQASWPDYVFEKDYHLPSLADVEKQIKDNGHLQGIPCAADVKSEGIELGEMNKLLLQKVEELTLYLIDQQKELKRQASEIESLKAHQNK